MLILIAGDDKKFRSAKIAEIVDASDVQEIIVRDDTMGDILDLQEYIYPSLFSSVSPIIHARFILSSVDIPTMFVKQLVASPTVFICEEFSVSAPIIALFKKHGAIIHTAEKIKTTVKKDHDIFAVTSALTAVSKKDRWLAYTHATEHHAVEAIVGILYWKLRDLIQKEKNNQKWKDVYTALITAHAKAWQQGIPLSLEVEKVLLAT